jgi:hypothetical protein
MARGGAGEQRSNSMDGLPAAPNHAADIALPKLKSKNGCSAARNFREHHVVGIFDQLPNDELEKFSHDGKITTNAHESTRISAGIKNPGVPIASCVKATKIAAVTDSRSDSAIFSIIHFRSASVRQLPFRRRMAPATPALFPLAQVLQAVRAQLPPTRLRPVFYFS